ncbi:MAG: hypothetical protein OXU81_12725 [Gammaproteobacteria bacterium]|nr:hypothetical protein [Gammaproteobacteria bacterium]
METALHCVHAALVIVSGPILAELPGLQGTTRFRPAARVCYCGTRFVTSTRFDPLSAARALEAAGVERTQAEAIASAIGNSGENATKADVSDLRLEISAVRAAISALEARMYRALWIQGGAIVAIVTALRLLE